METVTHQQQQEPTNESSESLREPLLLSEERRSLSRCTPPFNSDDDDDEEEGTAPILSTTSGSLTTRGSSSSSSSSLSSGGVLDVSSRGDPHSSNQIAESPRGQSGRSVRVARFDWISFGVFALILWFNFLVQAWQYSRRVLVQRSSISVRFNSIYISLVWSVLVAIFGECFRVWLSRDRAPERSVSDGDDHLRCGSRRGRGPSWSPSNGHSNTLLGSPECDENDPSGSNATQFTHRSAVAGLVSVSIVAGRPDLRDMVQAIGGSDRPAVLLCGPERLRENVRSTIRGDRECSRKCSIYEEVSEM